MILRLQGSGVMWNAYNFPVFLLSENSTLTLQEVMYCLKFVPLARCPCYGLSVIDTLDSLW
jgi:uncharacterized membrane protein